MRNRRAFLSRLAGSCAAGAAFGCARGEAEASPLVLQDAAAGRVRVEEGGLNPQPARWNKSLPDNWIECGLCPHDCRISEGERGTCGARENRGGRLFTLVHSRPCSIALDPVEKKPLFHVLPGASALSIATPGCNLWCKACQNWEIAQARPEQDREDPDVREVLDDRANQCSSAKFRPVQVAVSVYFRRLAWSSVRREPSSPSGRAPALLPSPGIAQRVGSHKEFWSWR